MAAPIGTNDGIQALRGRVERVEPPMNALAGENIERTLETLKSGHNQVWEAGGLAERLARLEAMPPFLRAPGRS